MKRKAKTHDKLMVDDLGDWVRPMDAKRVLDVGRSTLYEMLKSHELPSKRFGKRCIRIPKSALVARVQELTGV